MSEEKVERNDQEPAQIQDLEIEPLSDEDLESASGGLDGAGAGIGIARDGCSCDNTTSSCTG
ncbi:MAG: hypothetical protein QOF89_3760 [Acidobacteriota bacterium]|jgi:hypothetical protein|nr:hypothetical protein [Acidobacteriota bacterium]